MTKHALLASALVLLCGCGSSGTTTAPPPDDTITTSAVGDLACTAEQAATISALREHSMGASVLDLRGSCVHEFVVKKSVAPWVPMLAREQNFCGHIRRFSASNSTIGGIFDRDNDINVYVEASPGRSQEIYDFAVSFWGVTPDFSEMEVTVPEPLRTGNAYYPQPWTAGRLQHMLDGPHCFYGPWVSDNSHPGGPAHAEIHPIKASWWRDNGDLMVFSIQDESARFDQCKSYDPIANPLCKVADEDRADCVVVDGTRLSNWGREWTRGPMELRMEYLVDIPATQMPDSVHLETLENREVVTATVATSADGPGHYLTDAHGDTVLVVTEDPGHDALVDIQFDTAASCWSANKDSLHAIVNLTWALGKKGKWEYGIERDVTWSAPSPQSGRGYLVFRLTQVPSEAPPPVFALSRSLTPAQMDSLRARLVGMQISWQEVAGQMMPVADITLATNLEEEYGTQSITPTISGLRGIDPPDSVTVASDTTGLWTIRNVPMLFGGRVRLAPSDTNVAPSTDPGLSIRLPSYRMAAALLDLEPVEHERVGDDTAAWSAFLDATGGASFSRGQAPPSFSRIDRWRIVVQARLVPLLEDLDVDVARWRGDVPDFGEDGRESLMISPEQPFPDLTSDFVWQVAAADVAADSAIAVTGIPGAGNITFQVFDPNPSIGAIEVDLTRANARLVEVEIEYDAADTFEHRSIGDAVVYSLAFVDTTESQLRHDVLLAAVTAENVRDTDWIRAALAFRSATDSTTLSARSESLLILVATLTEDGLVDVDEFRRLRTLLRPSRD